MKPITGKLLRNGTNVESEYWPFCLVYENKKCIVTEDKDGDCSFWAKSNGYTFERDKWRVTPDNSDGAPYTIVADTHKYWILKNKDGEEDQFKKGGSFILVPYRPQIEITCKINGKESPLSKISEETLLNIRKESK